MYYIERLNSIWAWFRSMNRKNLISGIEEQLTQELNGQQQWYVVVKEQEVVNNETISRQPNSTIP